MKNNIWKICKLATERVCCKIHDTRVITQGITPRMLLTGHKCESVLIQLDIGKFYSTIWAKLFGDAIDLARQENANCKTLLKVHPVPQCSAKNS